MKSALTLVELAQELDRQHHAKKDYLATETALEARTVPDETARNLAMLVEVAARNHLLRTRGRDAARLLASRLERRLEELADRAMDVDSEEL
jgi:HPr kinase/phosphorylase